MRVHDVERAVVQLERIDVADGELDVQRAGVATRLLDYGGRRIDADNAPRRNSPADVSGETTSFAYDATNSLLLSATDPSGTTTYTYDTRRPSLWSTATVEIDGEVRVVKFRPKHRRSP